MPIVETSYGSVVWRSIESFLAEVTARSNVPEWAVVTLLLVTDAGEGVDVTEHLAAGTATRLTVVCVSAIHIATVYIQHVSTQATWRPLYEVTICKTLFGQPYIEYPNNSDMVTPSPETADRMQRQSYYVTVSNVYLSWPDDILDQRVLHSVTTTTSWKAFRGCPC